MSPSSEQRGRKRSTAEIRADIEATRSRLSTDIDVARERLSPQGLQRQAFGALRGVRREASGSIHDWSDSADQQASQMSSAVVNVIKRFPIATTVVGLGLALLAISNGRRSREVIPRPDPVADPTPVRSAAHADLPPPRG